MNKFIFIIALLTSFKVFSQTEQEAKIPYYQYTPNNQLGVNEFYDAYQNTNGLLYFGSDKGLVEFNGKEFKSIMHPKRNSNSITNIRAGNNQEMWMVNFAGQIFNYNNQLTLFDSSYSVNTIRFPSITYKNNKLYIAGNLGFLEYDIKTNNKKIIDNEIKDGYYWNACLYKDYAVCLNAFSGLILYNTTSKKSFKYNIPYEELNSSKLYSTGDELYFGDFTNKQLEEITFVNGVFKRKVVFNYSNLGKLITLFKENDSTCFISTTTGLYLVNFKTGLYKTLLKGNSISKIIKDNEGNIWCTSLSNGIYVFPNLNIYLNNTIELNSGEVINSFCDFRNNLIIGTNQGRVIIMSRDHKIKYLNSPGSFDIESIQESKQNNVLLVSCGQLFELDLNTYEFKLYNEIIRNVKSYTEAKGSSFYATSGGLYKLMNNESKQISKLRCTKVFSSKKHIYVLTQKGLIKYNTSNISETDTVFKNISEAIYCYNKIYCINFNDTLKCENTPLPYSNLKKLKVLNDSLFASNGNCIFYINPKNKVEEIVGPKDGMFCNRILDYTIYNNTFFVFTDKGLYEIKKRKKYSGALKFIENNKLQNEYFYDNQNASLSIHIPNFYSSLGNYEFVYRVKDIDTAYYNFSNGTTHYLKNLPTGKHTIQYALLSNTLLKFIPGKTFDIYIIPPFYQRWWFYLLLIIFTTGIATLYYKKRLINIELENQKKIQEQQLQADLRLSLLTALKAQMNPHFIFNALNSIQSYILKSDKLRATEYIGKFADLMRMVLNLSGSPSTKLKDEITALKLYLDLEGIQLNDFTYEIYIEDTVDEGIKIPSLLIQPYLENAIKHGLMHKDGDKKLLIEFSFIENDILKVSIKDNGIGRKKSAVINKNKTHKSFSTDANQKRLNLLNHKQRTSITCEFIDLYNDLQESIGTCVILNIPIFDESSNN